MNLDWSKSANNIILPKMLSNATASVNDSLSKSELACVCLGGDLFSKCFPGPATFKGVKL
jgi:hypothetical protein